MVLMVLGMVHQGRETNTAQRGVSGRDADTSSSEVKGEEAAVAARNVESGEPQAMDERRVASGTTEEPAASQPRRVTATSHDDKSEEYRRGWKVGQQRWEEELRGKSTQFVQNAFVALAEQYEHNRNTKDPEVRKTVDYLRGQIDAINTARMEIFAQQAKAKARDGGDAPRADSNRYKEAQERGFEQGQQAAQSIADASRQNAAQCRVAMQVGIEQCEARLRSLDKAVKQIASVGTTPPENLLVELQHALGMKLGFMTVAVEYLR